MANIIKLKKSSNTGNAPDPSSLEYGELAINYADGKLFYRTNNNTLSYFSSYENTASASWQKINSNTNAVSGSLLLVDSSLGSFTVTLPASPSIGNTVAFLDGGDWSLNPVTVSRNNSTIENGTDDVLLNIKGIRVDFVYDGSTWQVYAATGPQEIPSQTNNSGKYLTTDGTNVSWSSINEVDLSNVANDIIINNAGVSIDGNKFATTIFNISSTSTTAIDTWDTATYRSCKYLIQITQGSSYQVSELLILQKNSSTYLTEFAVIETDGSLATLSSDVSSNNVRLLVTMASSASAEINISKTLLSI